MVKFDLERGQEVARRREVAYKEGARRRDYCIPFTANTITVEQAKCTTSMTWVLSQPIKCYYRHHGPIKYLEKHDVLNYPFLLCSSVVPLTLPDIVKL